MKDKMGKDMKGSIILSTEFWTEANLIQNIKELCDIYIKCHTVQGAIQVSPYVLGHVVH